MAKLTDLPYELIQQIHLLALNPFFPLTCGSIHSILTRPSPSFAATYLLALYSAYGPSDLLVRSMRHPVCDIRTAKEIKRIWDRRRGYTAPSSITAKSPAVSGINLGYPARGSTPADHQHDERTSPATPQTTAPPLRCPELPRRIFRPVLHPTLPSECIPDLLHYLFEQYHPNPNSHKGYPLSRAVLTRNYELASYLLGKGADPGERSCLAIEVAISMKDLKMVKLLIDRDEDQCVRSERESSPSERKDMGGGGRVKRRKLHLERKHGKMNRVRVSSRMVDLAMRKGNEEIVRYFVHDKGVMPPLDAIMKLGKQDSLGRQVVKGRKLLGF